jgi:hypothetical protein
MKLLNILKSILVEAAPAAPTTTTITKAQVEPLLKGTKGKFFTITFKKRTNGNIRVMNARLGVRAYLKGGTLPYNAAAKNLLPVFDVNKKKYRAIPLDGISQIKLGNQIYNVQ